MFLSGFLGGPQLYVEQFHHSNVKQMHAHLEIGAVGGWLLALLHGEGSGEDGG